MSFFGECYSVFERASKTHDLSKDWKDYNDAFFYLINFDIVRLEVIKDFLLKIRLNNPIAATFRLSEGVQRRLLNGLARFSPDKLYKELQSEIPNLIIKGAFDSIRILNNLDEYQTALLATRMRNRDFTIFDEFKIE